MVFRKLYLNHEKKWSDGISFHSYMAISPSKPRDLYYLIFRNKLLAAASGGQSWEMRSQMKVGSDLPVSICRTSFGRGDEEWAMRVRSGNGPNDMCSI